MQGTKKIVITGTGRAGTTFLVQLLGELGLDTGFNAENWRESFDEHCHAGLERNLGDATSPRVIKNPELCRTLPASLRAGTAPAIEHVLIPLRDLQSAARSRIRIGGTDGEIPGGLWMTSNPAEQASVLATAFHDLLHALTEHDVPFTLLAFPRFAQDPAYTFAKLRFLLGDITEDTFTAVFQRVARPELIHRFPEVVPTDASIASDYRVRIAERDRRARARRARRHRLRLAAGAMTALVMAAAVFIFLRH